MKKKIEGVNILIIMKRLHEINFSNRSVCFKGNAFEDSFQNPKTLQLELQQQMLWHVYFC